MSSLVPEKSVSRSPVPDGIDEYAGKWVVIRDVEVVASADTLEELDTEHLEPLRDALYRVPAPGSVFF